MELFQTTSIMDPLAISIQAYNHQYRNMATNTSMPIPPKKRPITKPTTNAETKIWMMEAIVTQTTTIFVPPLLYNHQMLIHPTKQPILPTPPLHSPDNNLN